MVKATYKGFFKNTDRNILLKELFWLTLYFAILLPPVLVNPVRSGLDPSWQISLNLASYHKLIFGEEYIFTFGPLGFLMAKNAVVLNKWQVLWFELSMLSCTLYAMRCFLRSVQYELLCCLGALMVVFLISGTSCDVLMIFSYILFTLFFLKTYRWAMLLPVVALAAVSFYIKVNYGIIMSGLLYATLMIALIQKGISFKKVFLLAIAHIGIIGILAIIYHVHLISYLQSSIHIINAYNDAMFIKVKPAHKIMPVMAMVVIGMFVAAFLISYKQCLRNILVLYSYLFCAFFLYLMFKNGFVRADGHMNVFFTNSIIVFASVFVFVEKKYMTLWGSIFFLFVCIALGVLIANPLKDKEAPLTERGIKDKLFFGEYFSDIFTDVSYKSILQDSSRALHRVPEGYATLIGNSTVDIMPTEIAELYYYKMNYSARPIPQTYSAYDEYLDAKNAEKLTSDSGPEYLLYTNEAIDHRHPFWDESITKRAMLSHYELIAKDSMLDIATRFNEDRYLYLNPDVKASVETGVFKNGYEHYLRFGREESRQIISPGTTVFLLFKKRKTPLAMKVKKERSAIVKIGEELNISKTDHLQYLYADIQYNFLGKIQRLLFQPPQIDAIVKYEDGSTQRYQAIVPIMKTGVLINKKVDSKNDAIVFFMYQAGRNQNISSIRFEASNGFDGSIRATIKEILFE